MRAVPAAARPPARPQLLQAVHPSSSARGFVPCPLTPATSTLPQTRPHPQPGDKIVEISASFGDDVWQAQNFGQIMYAIRTRNGDVYLKIKSNFGDMSALEVRAAC